MNFCLKQGENAARFFFLFPPFDVELLKIEGKSLGYNFLGRIFGRNFRGINFKEEFLVEKPLQEKAPN